MRLIEDASANETFEQMLEEWMRDNGATPAEIRAAERLERRPIRLLVDLQRAHALDLPIRIPAGSLAQAWREAVSENTSLREANCASLASDGSVVVARRRCDTRAHAGRLSTRR